VRDNGIGIPAEIQDKLFRPFFTTTPTGGRHGTRPVPISYDIVTQQHGGTNEVDSLVADGGIGASGPFCRSCQNTELLQSFAVQDPEGIPDFASSTTGMNGWFPSSPAASHRCAEWPLRGK